MKVSGLYIYPLKGAAGIPQESAELDALGFRHDRRWLVVDAEGTFVTQRTQPRLALVRPELTAGALLLRAPGREPLALPLEGPVGVATEAVRIWKDTVQAVPAGDVAHGWISDYLERPARLVFFGGDALRPVDPEYAARPTDRVAFVDGYPCLLISEASLAALSARLPEPLPMNRFRPNVVVGGAVAHAEDGWRRIRAGEVAFRVVKPCARCAVPTVDQETGVAGEEPLRTLATYRKLGSKVMFGQNLIHEAAGTLRVGDPVTVVE